MKTHGIMLGGIERAILSNGKDCGVVAGRRSTGAYSLVLCFDEVRQLWWIVATKAGETWTLGYRLERHLECWTVFHTATEEQIADFCRLDSEPSS